MRQQVSDNIEEQCDSELSADMCDLCAAVHHIRCLLDCVGPRGDYSLCNECLNQNDGFSLAADQEALEDSSCSAIVPGLGSDDGIDACLPEVEHGKEVLLKTLHKTLEYIVMVLEGSHTKSHVVPDHCRSVVLHKTREMLQWKKQRRSQQEVDAEVMELN